MNARTRSALETCQQISQQMHMRSQHAVTRSATWYVQAHVGACSALNMNVNIHSFLYMSHQMQMQWYKQTHTVQDTSSIHACACIVPIHADAYRNTLDTCRANMDVIWEGKYELALMLHMSMIQVCWHADLSSMYLLCKSLCMAGFAQTTNAHCLTQEGACAQTLESCDDLQRVHKSWNNSSKHKNTFCAVFMGSWPAHSSMKSRRGSVSHRKRQKQAHIWSQQNKHDSRIISLKQSLPKPNAPNISPWCVQTHAEKCLVLKTRKHTHIHARLLIRVGRCAHVFHSLYRQPNKDPSSALTRLIHTTTK